MSVHTVLQPVGAGGDVSCGTHPNGFWEVRLENSSPTAFEALETALGKTAAAEAHGVVLTAAADALSSGDCEAQLAANSKSPALQATLRSICRERPVICVAEGNVQGAAAGLFLACSHRVTTSSTILSLPEVRVGLCPTSASALCEAGVAPHMAMYAAMTGSPLNSHDLVSLALATHFARADQVAPLLHELQFCPPAEFGVPLLRRTEPVPAAQASLCADGVAAPLESAIREVFGDATRDAADCEQRLHSIQTRTRRLTQSSAWRTRECADAVLDVLDGAERALRASSPSAVAATFVVLRRAAGLDAEAAQKLALGMNRRLSRLGDFKQAVACAGSRARPRWQPATLDAAADELRELDLS